MNLGEGPQIGFADFEASKTHPALGKDRVISA
jgi:hypothetical protein